MLPLNDIYDWLDILVFWDNEEKPYAPFTAPSLYWLAGDVIESTHLSQRVESVAPGVVESSHPKFPKLQNFPQKIVNYSLQSGLSPPQSVG